ncbi:MAG: hypothetical protein MI702_07145, partial [Chlorobiales bacterium]|nr:hypothetical protein [Chlorobiales bacterium]
MKLSQPRENRTERLVNLIRGFWIGRLPSGIEPDSGLPYWREVSLLSIVSLAAVFGLPAYLSGLRIFW